MEINDQVEMKFDVLNYPIVFATPRRLTDVTAWHGLLPVAFALIALHKPRVFVELGTHKGDSYCAFCQAVETLKLPARCYAVDTWRGDPQAGFYDDKVYEELKAYHDPLYGRFSSLLRMTFDEALSHFAEGEIDLLHIDGLHTYEAVRHDFETWLPKMSPRGVVIFHDIAVREGDFGVWRLWEEISRRYPTRQFGFSHGLGIAAVGGEALEGELGGWFGDAPEWGRIHALFAALGERWMKQDRIQVLEAELEGRRRELAAAARQMAEEHERWRHWSEEKAAEIDGLRADLEVERARAEAAATRLREQEEALAFARQQMEIVQGSWLWRAVGRYLFPTAVAGAVKSALPPVKLTDPVPVVLPDCIWSNAGRSWGGMRRFLTPVEAFGCHVIRQGDGLQVQAGRGRLIVRLNGAARDIKLVFRIAGEAPLDFFVEFGSLEKEVWRPSLRTAARGVPGRPAILHLSLPEVAGAMALEFPSPGPVNFAQIAVIAISPLERAVGPGLARLRLLGGGRRDAAVAPEPRPSADGDPYAYMAGGREVTLAGRRVAVLSSSQGNCFMGEIAATVAKAAEELGAEVVPGDEHSLAELAGCDWVVVTAPHEFFTLGAGRQWPAALSPYRERLLLLNTEQPQTPWFQTASRFFPLARAVLDIDYQTAVHLRRMGLPAYFLPLGHASRQEPPQALPRHPAFLHLPEETRRSLPKSYTERPLDMVFVGTASPRRKAFFARHAQFFSGLNTFIYLPEGNAPFTAGQARTLDFTALSALVRRARIVLNIHRDDHPYLEWQRIVNLGILQRTLVISEHCDFCPALQANVDYVDLPLELIPDACAHFLESPGEAEQFAGRACERLCRELPMDRVLSRLLAALEKTA